MIKSYCKIIPLDLVMQSLDKRCLTISKKSPIPLDDIKDAIKFLFTNTYFQFNNQIYSQIHGTPMGSPLSQILADMVLDDLETTCLKKLNFNPIIFKRYVDDVITLIPAQKIQHILDIFNSYHNRLKFTHELEEKCRINFLDITLIRKTNIIITDWYHKPTSSGRVLNFKSNHPFSQKVAMIYNLVDKVLFLSNPSFHTKNLQIAKSILLANSYPLNIINKYFSKRIHSQLHPIPPPLDIPNTSNRNNLKKIIQIPYTDNLYHQIKKHMKSSPFFCVPKITSQLSSIIIKGKDKTPLQQFTNIVYKIPCKNCNASYVGEAKRQLSARLGDHIRDVNKNNKKTIPTHCRENGHSMDWGKVSVLNREKIYKKRLTSEMLFINLQDNPLNIKEDSNNSQNSYKRLINAFK